LDDLLLEEWSAACVLMEVALASPDPDAYFDIRSRWRKVELTVVAVLGDTGTMELASDESPYLRALAARDMGSRDMGSRDMSAASGLLERLAADAALIVRVAVASNPATPDDKCNAVSGGLLAYPRRTGEQPVVAVVDGDVSCRRPTAPRPCGRGRLAPTAEFHCCQAAC
jgi:hypothetical protein